MRSTNHTGGFTIVEVLLAILIMGLMFASITQLMTAARSTRDQIHNMQETQLAGPAVLDMMERDLRGLLTAGLPRDAWLKVQDRVVQGQDADRIDFVTTTDSLIERIDNYDERVRGDYNEVGYVLRVNPDDQDFLELYRREDMGIDDEPHEGGEYTFLSDQLVAFDVEVYAKDGPDEDPEDEWDPTAAPLDEEEPAGLPASLKLSLTVELKPRIDRESLDSLAIRKRRVTYVRWVRIPEDLRFEADKFPRLALPAAPGSSSATSSEGSGEGEGDDPNDPSNPTDPTNPNQSTSPTGDNPTNEVVKPDR